MSVTREPRIVVVSTGDELVEPGQPVSEWQIYRSNAYAVLAALKRRGFNHVRTDHLPDDLPTLRSRLRMHLDQHDVMILSGGVSMGRFDYVPQVLEELGVQRVFHKIAQRPGKPMWFGVGPGAKAVYALPGNPVSTLICLARYGYLGLDVATGNSASGTPAEASMDADFEVKPALTFFLPVAIAGAMRARPCPTQGSGDFTSLLGTDGFVELPPGPALVTRETRVPFYPW
jgi:molybdopterin molybdotransferase